MAMEKGRVCVTGAGGFVASWLVKLLLSRDYSVHGTVRNPSDPKYAHLNKFDKASDRLKLFKADVLDLSSLQTAIEGCDGVFHVASPVPSSSVPNPLEQIVEPAVKGTLNVLKACSEANVKRVVYVSSVVAVCMNPDWPKDQLMDETCWSDKEYCRKTDNWYCFSKTEAESEAIEYAKANGLDVVTLLPTLVLGPIMQPTANASSLVLAKLLKEGYETMENKNRVIVDVRDVVDALLMLYEKPEAQGRYLCKSHTVKSKDIVDILSKAYPNYKYPKSWTESNEKLDVSSEKLKRLGWSYRPLEETLIEAVESYKETGLVE
ncbi:hypothetical protein V2J09_017206 [Rumex salicifolius]